MKLTTIEIDQLTHYITAYESFEDFCRCVNYDESDFSKALDEGFIQEITCGTYNGATNTFAPWQLTDRNIIEMCYISMLESDFINSMDYDNILDGINTQYQQLEFYLSLNSVFTFDDKVYLNEVC